MGWRGSQDDGEKEEEKWRGIMASMDCKFLVY